MKDLIRVWTFIGLGIFSVVAYALLLQYRTDERHRAGALTEPEPVTTTLPEPSDETPENVVTEPTAPEPVAPKPEQVVPHETETQPPIQTETVPPETAPEQVPEVQTNPPEDTVETPVLPTETTELEPSVPESKPEESAAVPKPELTVSPRQDIDLCPPFADGTTWTQQTPKRGEGLLLTVNTQTQVRVVTAASVLKTHETNEGILVYLLSADGKYCITYSGLQSVTLSIGATLVCGESIGDLPEGRGLRFSVHQLANPALWWQGDPVDAAGFLVRP